MSPPRQILPGASYLITRRCAQRQLLLTPSSDTTEIFTYVLAQAISRYAVELHVACVMSNHYHLVVTDPDARLPAFQQYLDALVARAMNAYLGRQEDFWGPPTYSAVTLASPADIVDKVAYALANPSAAGLVATGREWPGLWTAPEQLGGGVIRAPRPGHFFVEGGTMPTSASTTLTTPPGFESAEAFRDLVAAALAEREEEAVSQAGPAGFMGARRVLEQSPASRPSSVEAPRRLNPRIAAKDPRLRTALLERLRAFLVTYRDALEAWRQDAPALFPEGTYLMRVAHGAVCAGAG